MVAEKVKAYLDDKGIKGSVLAKKVGITQQQMSSVLTGRTTLKADVFFKICEVLEVSPEIFDPKNEDVSA